MNPKERKEAIYAAIFCLLVLFISLAIIYLAETAPDLASFVEFAIFFAIIIILADAATGKPEVGFKK